VLTKTHTSNFHEFKANNCTKAITVGSALQARRFKGLLNLSRILTHTSEKQAALALTLETSPGAPSEWFQRSALESRKEIAALVGETAATSSVAGLSTTHLNFCYRVEIISILTLAGQVPNVK